MSSSSRKMLQAAAGNAGGDFYPYTVDYSARFNDNDSAQLGRTPSSAGNRKTWTYSVWIKRSTLGTRQILFGSCPNTASNDLTWLTCGIDETTDVVRIAGWNTSWKRTNAVLRDTSSWYHLVFVWDTTQATGSDRSAIYINGIEATYQNNNSPSLNTDYAVNDTKYHTIGSRQTWSADSYFDGYMAQACFVDGQALDPTSFGEFKNGVWVPKDVSGLTFGTNGFLLDFSNSAALGTDSSGNSNNWTPSGLTSSDQMIDTPTSNWATLNPLQRIRNQPVTYAEGNLYVQYDGSDNAGEVVLSTIRLPDTGKWYFEGIKTGGTYYSFGVNTEIYSDTKDAITWGNTATGRVGVMVDCDTNTMYGYVNGTLTTTTSITSEHRYFKAHVWSLNGSGRGQVVVNFGQNGTFNGTTTAQGNTDANGLGDFYYAPPSGALALCTANLPEPTIGPNSDTTSDENFNTVLYTGNGSTQSITGVGFQPDLIWVKGRDYASNHWLTDVIRGTGSIISTSTSTIYSGLTNAVTSFDSDGFSLGNDGAHNASGYNFVGWTWKGNGSGVTNNDGAITSTVSANTDAGISIVTFTSTSSITTVGHGLGITPSIVITKRTNIAGTPYMYFNIVDGSADYIALDSTNAKTDYSSSWSDVATSSTLFSISSTAGNDYIEYAFAEVDGFSKFGKYTGNGSSTDGPFIYTGFRPSFVMIKRTDSAGNYWPMHDSKRPGYNLTPYPLYANSTATEDTSHPTARGLDFLSNGIKVRAITSDFNLSGATYIYMAFAENPFKYSNAR